MRISAYCWKMYKLYLAIAFVLHKFDFVALHISRKYVDSYQPFYWYACKAEKAADSWWESGYEAQLDPYNDYFASIGEFLSMLRAY